MGLALSLAGLVGRRYKEKGKGKTDDLQQYADTKFGQIIRRAEFFNAAGTAQTGAKTILTCTGSTTQHP